MIKPNLFIIGAPKCGTTAWYEYLKRHTEISFSEEKEPHYFCEDFPNFRWARSEPEYLKLFEGLDTRYVGESSVMYLYSQVAVPNLIKFSPDAKVLVFLRKYDEFIQSYHSQLFLMHEENCSDPNQAWRKQEARRRGESVPNTCREPKFLQYKEVARFGEQLQRCIEHVPKEQLKVIFFERWTKAPRDTYLEIMDFLGLEDDGFDSFSRINEKRSNRFQGLARFLHRPPKAVLSISSMVKKVLGIQRLRLSKKLQKLNEKPRSEHLLLDPSIKEELLASLAQDRALIEQIAKQELTHWQS